MSPLSIVFAIAACLVVWLVNPPRTPPTLPPLAPTAHALPTLAPLGAGGGTSPFRVIASVAPWVLVAWLAFGREHHPTPAPGPDPSPVSGLDLRGKFVGPHAAEDAAITRSLTRKVAQIIAWDALPTWEGQPKEPRLRTATQLAELRSVARQYDTEGVRLGDRQPLAVDAIAKYLEAKLGTDGGPVDDAAKRRWIDAMEVVSEEAGRAIGR